MRNKIIYIIMIVVLLGFAFTFTSAVAYWSTELDTTNVQIEVSDEVAHLEVLDMNSEVTGWLVPEGYDHFAGEVTEVIFRYQVSLDKELIRTINLIVESMEVTIGGETTYAHLVDIDIGGEKDLKIYDLYNDSVTVVIKVRLIEPIDALEAASKGID
ncbi:MAG TPA: hypothetical protein PKY72_06010, partial [Bacilli bacterium]|nr:hypothetical protein [Bacilli bacterium]